MSKATLFRAARAGKHIPIKTTQGKSGFAEGFKKAHGKRQAWSTGKKAKAAGMLAIGAGALAGTALKKDHKKKLAAYAEKHGISISEAQKRVAGMQKKQQLK